MPLFKRRQRPDEESPDDESEEGKHPKKKGDEEAPEEEGGPEGKTEGEAPVEVKETLAEEDLEDEDTDEEDEDIPSIDELLEEASMSDDKTGSTGVLEDALGELAGEDVQVLKMARKVVVIGDPAVGKTSLIKRWVQDVFDDRYLNTIGAKVMKKELGITRPDTGEIVDLKLILWDIAGQESFDTVKKAYYRGASGAIVICDVTRRETMDHMHKWIENLFDVSEVIPMVIIINKIDLDSEFTFSEEEVIDEYAPYGAGVYLTSARTGENVEMVFHELGKIISK